MIRKILITLGLILGWAFFVAAIVFVEANWFAAPPVVPGDFKSIDDYLVSRITKAVEDKRLGGAALVLMQELGNGNRLIAKHGFGIANAETGAAVDPDQTLFRVASVSKAVTAWA